MASLSTAVKTWEQEIYKIKCLPISIAEKRLLKLQITSLPSAALKNKYHIKCHLRHLGEAISRRWKRRIKIGFWQKSLQDIEVRGGTSIVNVFIFIKWTITFNLILFLVVFGFIILPYMVISKKPLPEEEKCPVNFNQSIFANNSLLPWNTNLKTANDQLAQCCLEEYHDLKRIPLNENFWTSFRYSFSGDRSGFAFSPLTYGFYVYTDLLLPIGFHYDFQKAYLIIPVIIFLLSLITMVWQIGVGIKEMTLAKEGEFYKFSNLVFAGWDHYTKDEAGVAFKKKILCNEMKIALKTEKLKVKRISKKQKVRLLIRRIFANVLVLVTIIFFGGIIYYAADYSIRESCERSSCANPDAKKRNEVAQEGVKLIPPVVIAVCNLIFPIILKHIRRFEAYSHEVQTTLMLVRSLVVRVLAIAFIAVKYYIDEYCEKKERTCVLCSDETDTSGIPLDKDACWESLFGLQIYTIVLVDLAIKAFLVLVIGYGRHLLGKLTNWGCLVSVTKFNIIRHSLDIIYIQTLAWFFYFAPFLPLLVTIYCVIMGYLKKFTLMVLSQSVPDTFRTTKTTTVYVATKLIAFVAASLTIGFVLTRLEPSRGCGPFRGQKVPWAVMTQVQSETTTHVLDILSSPGVTVPLLIVMVTLGYYYYASAQAHRHMVEMLRHILILEGQDKQYLFARLITLREEADLLYV